MTSRRPGAAGKPRQPIPPALRAKRTVSTLPVRVGLIVAAAACPPVLVIASGDRSLTTLILVTAFSVSATVVAIEYIVTRPLRALRAAVDQWRHGDPFDIDGIAGLPSELRGLALSFKRATRTLSRREEQLRAAVERQDLAMQEIHHRVKNNLQIVASLLNLQASRIRSPAAKAEFQSARDRVRALATVHRHLYAHGEVHAINMRAFLLELCSQLFQAMGEAEGERLTLDVEAPELEMSSDQAVPLSLIVTEAVTNAVKYAYPDGRQGAISIRLSRDGELVELEIKDDGIGILAGQAETAAGTRDGIGIQLINGFSRQLGAQLEVEQGAGTRYLVRMRLRRERLGSPALGPDRGAAGTRP